MKNRKKIFVFAPANSMKSMSAKMIQRGIKNLNALGFEVEFGRHVNEGGAIPIASISQRIEDFNSALQDKEVKIIMAVFGGYNSSDLLPHLDYEAIKQSDKLLMGYSDFTAILNGVHAKTNAKSILGMGFASFCAPEFLGNAISIFQDILNSEATIEYPAALHAADDFWYMKQNPQGREAYANTGYQCIREGKAEGELVGGNLDTFCQLVSTPYAPNVKGNILLVETASSTPAAMFLRDLSYLKQSGILDEIGGLLIGKFHQDNIFSSAATLKEWSSHLFQDLGIPIISNVHFSHVDPIYPAVIGADYIINSSQNSSISCTWGIA
jgi:muramoyltetrapeptide carboxypeptidase